MSAPHPLHELRTDELVTEAAPDAPQSDAIKYRLLFDNSPDGLLLLDLENLVPIEFNDALLRMLGYTREQFARTPVEEYIPPESREPFAGHIARLLKTGHDDFETHVRCSDGRIIDIHCRCALLESQGRKCSQSILRDISVQKRTARELRESERRFERMADLAPVLMWVSGPDGACNYFNETWLRFTGLTLTQAAGWGWLDCVHPADAARWQTERAHGNDGARQRGPFRAEYRLRRADGKYRWIDAQGAPRFDADGGFLGYVGCGVDVTERAEAEVEIGEWKARYDAAARATGQVLYDWDRASNQIIWSGSTQDVFGYAPAELRTREEWIGKVHPRDRHRIEASLDDFLRDGAAEPASYRVVRPDGSYVTIEARRLGLRGSDGKVDRVIGFLSDITERRRLEREVIEVANREQVRIGNDLHDGLGQELTGIALLMKSISSQARIAYPQLAAELATVTDLLSHAVASCRALAQGVSAYALERGGLETALLELAQTSRNVFGFECAVSCARGLSRQLNEQQAYQLYRIAQEAVSNAAKHSGGRRVEVRLEALDSKIRLVVSDDGKGLKAPGGKAAGMGLRTMRYRAAMIGAQLQVDAEPTKGTRVTCSLKLDTRAGEEPRPIARRKTK